MGSLLDPEELPHRIASLLRVLGALMPLEEGAWGLGVAISPGVTLGIGSINDLGRRSSALSAARQGELRVWPDEAGSSGALSNGAEDAGFVLAQSLVAA